MEQTTIKVGMESICPMKMDRNIEGRFPKPKNAKDYENQAWYKVYRLDQTEDEDIKKEKDSIAIPAASIKACIREASVMDGRGVANRINDIKAFIFIEPEFITIDKKKADLIDKRWVTRTNGKKITRVISYRPLIKEWKCSFTMTIMMGKFTTDAIKGYLEYGGIARGILSHRPEFGRFIVTKWDVTE